MTMCVCMLERERREDGLYQKGDDDHRQTTVRLSHDATAGWLFSSSISVDIDLESPRIGGHSTIDLSSSRSLDVSVTIVQVQRCHRLISVVRLCVVSIDCRSFAIWNRTDIRRGAIRCSFRADDARDSFPPFYEHHQRTRHILTSSRFRSSSSIRCIAWPVCSSTTRYPVCSIRSFVKTGVSVRKHHHLSLSPSTDLVIRIWVSMRPFVLFAIRTTASFDDDRRRVVLE